MATLYVNVWTDAQEVALGPVEQSLTVVIGATTQQTATAVLQNGTLARKRVRLFADADCFVAWGTNPTADSSGVPIGANNPEYFDVPVGTKFAAIEKV